MRSCRRPPRLRSRSTFAATRSRPSTFAIPLFGSSGCSNSAAVSSCVRPTSTSAAFRPFALRRMAHFIALTDKGWWFRGRILYEGTRPSGIADAEMAPILGADGRPLAARGWYDTESIAEDGGTLYVGIERVHQIVRFNYGKDGLLARGQPIALPPGLRSLPPNRGIEALVFVPKGLPLAGTLIAISERGLDKAGNTIGFLIGGASPGNFAVRRSSNYDITDAALLPGGDVLLLERRFSWSSGLAVRLRRIALGEIKPGAIVDGPVLF